MEASRFRMNSRTWGLLLLLFLLPGCGKRPAAVEVYDESRVVGQVDPSLPEDAQARQQALKDVLDLIHRGIEPQFIRNYQANLDFKESNKKFYGDNTFLKRWEFDGAPTGVDVPVRLTFVKESPEGNSEIIERRVYHVLDSGNVFRIRRRI